MVESDGVTKMSYTYKTIVSKATECKSNVQKQYKVGMTYKWSYYFAKSLISPKKDVKKISIEDAPKPSSTHISRQISKKSYLKLANNLVSFVEKNHRLPNYLAWGDYKISQRLYTYTFARCLVYVDKYGKYDDEITINEKVFTKPLEATNEVYKYFVKVFGEFDNTVDGFLKKIQGLGYGYYYDDVLSNKQVIDNLKKKGAKKPNCTDSCQMAMNIIKQLILFGKYKKVECLHVQCSSGGHVKLRITKNDGTRFIRDVACVISDNGKPITCVWCTNTPKAIDPKWFMANLNR